MDSSTCLKRKDPSVDTPDRATSRDSSKRVRSVPSQPGRHAGLPLVLSDRPSKA